jgi:hypothetical protein
MKHSFVLIHSPVHGPEKLQRLADALKKRGHGVAAPSLTPVLSGAGPYFPKAGDAIATSAEELQPKDGVVIVAHTGGGALAPAAAGAMRSPVRAVVFVDGMMPHPNRSWFSQTPIELQQSMRAGAKDGCYTPYGHKVPLAYFEEVAPSNEPLRDMPIGYLLISEASRETYENAQWMRWATREALGDLDKNADRIAQALEALTNQLTAAKA